MEKLSEMICNNCGGDLEQVSLNIFKCKCCGSQQYFLSDEQNILCAEAFSCLRRGDFDQAEDMFTDIIIKNSACAEAYWGRALTRNGIVFVDDIVENKKVPTCMAIKETSFLSDTDFLAALQTAEIHIKETYRLLGEKIEQVRLEWLSKARNESPCDIFICYKESNNGARTEDSYEAQSLYTHLVQLGYKVFFARESLRDKVSDRYEPYIYNALKTAKVMIVYGQKAEHFRAVWVKNEWARFIGFINEGTKHQNSLIVAYEKMSAEGLPQALKARQCLDASRKTFLQDLDAHIQKILLAVAPLGGSIDRIQITQNPIKKDYTPATVKLRNIGSGASSDVVMDEERKESIVKKYLAGGMITNARKFISDELSNNPQSGKMKYYKLLLDNKVTSGYGLATLKSFKNYGAIDDIIADSDKDSASQLLINCYLLAANMANTSPKDSLALARVILPYDFDIREKCVTKLLNSAASNPNFFVAMVDEVAKADPSNAVDILITAGDSALAAKSFSAAIDCFEEAAKLDNSATAAYRGIIRCKCKQTLSARKMDYDAGCGLMAVKDDFENVLKTVSGRAFGLEVRSALDSIIADSNDNGEMVKAFNHFIKYYPGELSEISDIIKLISDKCLRNRNFKDVVYYQGLLLGINRKDPACYWNIILAKTGCICNDDVLNSNVLIDTMEEYNKLLAVASDADVDRCIAVAREQRANYMRNKESKKKSSRGLLFKIITASIVSAAIIAGIVIVIIFT